MKAIPQFPEYSANEDGYIFRTGYSDSQNRAKYDLPHQLVGKSDKDGYLKVTLAVDGQLFYKRVHRLIAETFIPNPLGLPMVNHKNGIKTDNRVENLEWISARGNTHHAFETGLHKGCRTKVILRRSSEMRSFSSVTEAAEYLGHSRDCFRRHLADPNHGEIDGWKFELIGGKTREVMRKWGA